MDTTFVNGTVVQPDWLNDINDAVYQSGLVGVAGSTTRNLADRLAGIQVSIADFAGDDPTGATTSDVALNAAITYANFVGGGMVYIPTTGNRTFYQILPKSNVHIWGVKGMSRLKQVQPISNIQTGIYKPAGAGSVDNFHITGIYFDGNRQVSPASLSNHIIQFDCGNSEALTNCSINDCYFKNAQEDCFRLIASNINSGVSNNIVIKNCVAITEDAFLFEGTNHVFTDLVRIEQTWDYASAGEGYGNVYFTNIEVSGCYAEKIRTLADLKRGCAYFVVSNCRTKNMYDCHHSVDGSFYGNITNVVCQTESTTTIASTFTNFIEIQGEHITVGNANCYGGNKVINGIMVTAYGRPIESGKGHRSFKVVVKDCEVDAITSNGYRVQDGNECVVTDCEASFTGAHVASLEAGSKFDTDGVTLLFPIGCEISNINNKNCTTGVLIAAAAVNTVYGACYDDHGNDFLDIPTAPSGSTTIVQAATYGNFTNKYPPRNLLGNPLLEWVGAGATNAQYWTTAYAAFVDAATKPNNVPRAVTVSDTNGAALQAPTNTSVISLVQGQYLYGRVSVKQGSASAWAIFVQELDSSGVFIANYFYGTVSPINAWTDYVFRHTGVNANCTQVNICISPAAASNIAANTGTTDMAEVRVGRTAWGIK